MTFKEAVRDNLDKANKFMDVLNGDEEVPVDVASVYVAAGHTFISASLVAAVQDLTREVREVRDELHGIKKGL